MRGELPGQEQTTCSGNSRRSSVCRLARIEWNNRRQPETPARRRSRVSSAHTIDIRGNRNDVSIDTYSFGLVVHSDNPIDQ